jgi:hypothetical protein
MLTVMIWLFFLLYLWRVLLARRHAARMGARRLAHV